MRKKICLAMMMIVLTASMAVAVDHAHMNKVALAWFESHNSGDAEVIRAFIAENRTAAALEKRPLEERVQRRMGMFGQVGEVEVKEVLRETDDSIVFRGYATTLDMWMECSFKFETVAPFKLDEIMLRPTTAPGQEIKDVGEWNTVEELLVAILEQTDVPGLAAAIVENGEVVDAAAVGMRESGTDVAVTIDDLWHIGSITKSMTATMIGALVDDGILTWDITLTDALPDVEMRDEYRDVTLADLLHHRGGIQPYTILNDDDEARLSTLAGSATEIRAGFALEVLGRDPANARGVYNYSNAGYALAGLIAETASGKSWRELMRTKVFEPAGMTSATFGWPATPERPDQPRGHFEEDKTLRVQGLEEYALGEYIAPAGDVCMTITDLARFAAMHLRGVRGEDGAVSADTFRWLHTIPSGKDSQTRYAAGWMLMDSALGETHAHNGSAGTFFSLMELYPDKDRVVVVMMNVGFQRGQATADKVVELINKGVE